jgi:predicted 3-demethylubiquinone-9 3-methyltransferase (glyoxalase superfamily)
MAEPTITPFLCFNTQAEDAARFYVSLVANSRIETITHYPAGAPAPAGSVMTVEFVLAGTRYIALNSGPMFTHSEAFSLAVTCTTQAEIDDLWAKLCDGGTPIQCGWLKDRYGLSWQIVPHNMPALMCDPDPAKCQRVMAAMMRMTKLNIQLLEDAYHGR